MVHDAAGLSSQSRTRVRTAEDRGVGLRRLRHHARLGAGRPPRRRRWGRGVELVGGDRGSLGRVVLLLPSAPGRRDCDLVGGGSIQRQLGEAHRLLGADDHHCQRLAGAMGPRAATQPW